ncbi:protein MODIFIED TRANSPORT TO THE VACUOLE 1 [Malania oleifera]|uniref:protein MODIFIED TRANSPORT TO THE VACUOLE 1 n=1 Tax=Malania oleifera TaxID=397392 RepID=UPI0025ADA26C|nr:protein MODIFIED TRANSPORT TO THE VACUOLE 1 [Malania oleifera]
MDSSRRAVESYWRSRMIDAATSDEDKVTPVYKLEEICELLRSSSVGIVKEMCEFILKRLDHKSPIVKQKALRLIKYAVGKSGVEFRREMQRNSVAVRQLLHYKGLLDALKGDALNKAVRDTAQETISAIFSVEDSKPAPSEDLTRRIQGFGNTNFEMPLDDKKSFLSEVVGIGSASIKQGLSSFTQAHSVRKNDNGSYRSPNLRRSLTTEIDYHDRYEKVEHPSQNQGSFGISKNVSSGPWVQDLRITNTELTDGDSGTSHTESKTREDKLLETIVTSGGVRLQPTRDAIQVFLVEAAKLDALALSHSLESRLQSQMWQVRMKALCVLESILRKKEDEHFLIVASYFSENKNVVVKCSESPQASLREKANKVLSLLGGEERGSVVNHVEKPATVETATVIQMPDLIDTGDPDDYHEREDSTEKQIDQSGSNLPTPTTPLIDDIFGDSLGTGVTTTVQKIDDDPFADVSFHTSESREPVDDLFSGMTVDDKPSANANENHLAGNKKGPELFDIFGSNPEHPQEQEKHKNLHYLMDGLSINENDSKMKQKETSSGTLSETIFPDSSINPGHQASNEALNGPLASQMAGVNPNLVFPLGSTPYNIPPGIMFNPAFPSQPINYGAMGSLFTQPQLLATMSNFQQMGHLSSQAASFGHAGEMKGGYSPPLPDIFNPNMPTHTANPMMSSSKKEETKAFDFISDHLAAARDTKRVI